MNYLPNLTQISDALGWAVLHSLWQGALAAVLVWVFRNITRESAADTRYMVGFITLVSLLVAFIGTFLYYFSIGGAATGIETQLTEVTTLPLTGTAATPVGNPLLRVTDYTSFVGAIWAGCFALLGMRYLAAFRLTHKLRTNGLSDLPSNWQENFNDLAKRSNVTGRVRGFISEHVSSPITFGFWKPIVLVPAWFFSGLTPAQCEAVLLHEFAHIRRHDYLTNILQILVKTVLFYHPAVQYISKVMDTDREHACDDFAVLVTNSPEMLAKALGTIRLKAARDGGVFALSADGPEAPLMHRLKRLMGAPTKKTHSGSGRGFAATLMIAISSAMVFGLGATESLAHPHKPDTEVLADDTKVTETLAGASDNIRIKALGSDFNNKIMFKGDTYIATSFDFQNKDDGFDIINGKKYPSKYMYSVYAKDGKSYVVKQKNGKKYIEVGENWYAIDKELTTSQKYAYSTTTIDGKKYKTRTNTRKNQTFIKINGNWHDIDKANLDRLIPTASVTPTVPVPPKYSYTYAKKDGQKYKIKTKNKTGKTYIYIDNDWQKASISGGGDHGHRHVKIDGEWVNIEGKSHSHTNVTTFNNGNMKVITDTHGNTRIGFDNGSRNASKIAYVYNHVKVGNKIFDVKTKNKSGKSYAKFGDAWVHVKNKWQEGERSPSKVKISDTWYPLMQGQYAHVTPPTPPVTPNYWIDAEVRQQVEDAVERATEQREQAAERREEALERAAEQRERAEEQRERAQEQRMAAIERAVEQRERAHERAEEQREKALERAEEQRADALERAEEQRERAAEQRERAQEQVERAHEKRERAHEKRERAREQAERQRDKEATSRYEEMRDRLIPVLKADGYLPNKLSTLTMKMTKEDIFINGKLLPSAQEGKYCDIVSDYGMRKDDMKQITIKPDSFQISSTGDHGNTRVTIGTFKH